MARTKNKKDTEAPTEKSPKTKTDAKKREREFEFLQNRRLIINGTVREYQKGEIIKGELFAKNYPDDSGLQFLHGLLEAGILK
ncbi:hypothetical protein NO1_1692 [Candidatus Termititenax aidoneus]|uniref:Uncharacterized protein n=1 Tax=Termititenax aidoneus TaxID=2218524 RepID=A0A388TDB5_TERA1|nr:hypothetical protein NO1_1692 [Candidatus Termititenax aidoneus]